MRRDGVEATLQALLSQGVYLTVDEFKGRRPVVRGTLTVDAGPVRLRNALATPHFWGLTGGSRGAATRSAPRPGLLARSSGEPLPLARRAGGRRWRNAVWGTPSITAHALVLRLRPAGSGVVLAGRPRPSGVASPVPVERPRGDLGQPTDRCAVAQTGIRAPRRAAPSCSLDEGDPGRGRDPAPVGIPQLGGHLVPGRRGGRHRHRGGALHHHRRACHGGASRRHPPYGGRRASPTTGARTPAGPSPTDASPPRPPTTCTSSRTSTRSSRPTRRRSRPALSSSPRCGRRCPSSSSTSPWATAPPSRTGGAGVPWRRWAGRRHLHTIRSFEKLTAGGMTFVDTDVVRVLEEVLPRRFGGGPIDYQLIEDEGRTVGRDSACWSTRASGRWTGRWWRRPSWSGSASAPGPRGSWRFSGARDACCSVERRAASHRRLGEGPPHLGGPNDGRGPWRALRPTGRSRSGRRPVDAPSRSPGSGPSPPRPADVDRRPGRRRRGQGFAPSPPRA